MAMSSLSSCTTLLISRAPPAPGKSSPAAALQLLRSRQPAAASTVPALRWASRKEFWSRFACHAHKYNIEPSALVHPRAFDGSDWSLGEDKNRITVSLNVGESTTEGELEVATTEDQTLLVISYKKDEEDKSSSSSPASSLDVRLLMPPGYDSNKMQAIMWNTGCLEISIPKPKHERRTIPITPLTANIQTTPPTTTTQTP